MVLFFIVDLKEIYKKSWGVAIKHKALWVIGAAVAAFSSGGRGFSNFSNTASREDFGKMSQSTVTSNFQPLVNLFTDTIKSVPTGTWVVLGLSFLIAIFFGIVISIVSASWAQGSLIGGINEALEGKTPTIKSSSSYGLKNLKSLIWLRLIPGLLFTGVSLVLAAVLGLIFVLVRSVLIAQVLMIVLIALGLLAGLFVTFTISAVQVWAVRVAVLEGRSGKESFFEGLHIVKKHLGKMLGLGTVNCFTGCLVGCATILIWGPLLALIVGAFAASGIFAAGFGNLVLLLPAIGVSLPLILCMSVVATLINSIYMVFNYSTWNILYKEIREEGDKLNG